MMSTNNWQFDIVPGSSQNELLIGGVEDKYDKHTGLIYRRGIAKIPPVPILD